MSCTLGSTRVPASQAAAPVSHSTLTGAELPEAKKILASMHAGLLRLCLTLCDPVDCGLPDFSFRERVLQARILKSIGQYRLPYSSRALYFLLPSLSAPLSTWCCQNPWKPSSCTTSTPGPHRGKPRSSRATSGAKPQWATRLQRWK